MSCTSLCLILTPQTLDLASDSRILFDPSDRLVFGARSSWIVRTKVSDGPC
jgi:hypothetical protein